MQHRELHIFMIIDLWESILQKHIHPKLAKDEFLFLIIPGANVLVYDIQNISLKTMEMIHPFAASQYSILCQAGA